MLSYDLAFSVGTAVTYMYNHPLVVLQSEPRQLPGGASIPTSIFRDPKLHEPDQSNFKTQHYEHMRQWLQAQELKGNIIKFSLLDSKYCVGYQRSTYKGMKPHFFVYDILKR